MKNILSKIIQNPTLHGKWLNTLSYLENCGARKIAATEHPLLVEEEKLKHAAEEFRHAHYLKEQIPKVASLPFPNYALPSLLGSWKTKHYLDRLEVEISRILKQHAYVFVTYAIEKRAEKLYPLYHILLQAASSPVRVKSILLEEEEHLAEMEREIEKISCGEELKKRALQIEEKLFQNWKEALWKSLGETHLALS
ncbi:MAG: hypothetical protein K940chlam9_00742 [Chlamydiae bacterium]|nr:hypothetical protein [Chlamydiota bacterium]